LRNEGDTLARQFAALIQPFRNMALDFRNMLLIVARALSASTSHIENGVRGIVRAYERELERHSDFLERGELTLKQSDPMRQLRLGYSIVRAGGALVRSVSHIKPNERFEVRLCDGTLEATATSVSPLTDHTK
jgi:exonuclease VII large subunit